MRFDKVEDKYPIPNVISTAVVTGGRRYCDYWDQPCFQSFAKLYVVGLMSKSPAFARTIPRDAKVDRGVVSIEKMLVG